MGMPTMNISTGSSWERNPKNPNPAVFKILHAIQIGKNIVAHINYPGCENYEGNKVLVFENMNMDDFIKLKTIDPHFYPNNKIIARFKPDNAGWNLACEIALIHNP